MKLRIKVRRIVVNTSLIFNPNSSKGIYWLNKDFECIPLVHEGHAALSNKALWYKVTSSTPRGCVEVRK